TQGLDKHTNTHIESSFVLKEMK
ncbi:MAG: hypothetical protein JWP85_2699, partial [Rhodoglobus sp.]|nr:hypothetical protein [Rhodoglobus sp.]